MKKIIFYLFVLNILIRGALLAEPFVVHEYSKTSSNKNSNKLVNSLKVTRDIANIIPMEKNIIIVVLMDTYFEINKDKST